FSRALVEMACLIEEESETRPKRVDARSGETLALQSDQVQSFEASPVTPHHAVGNDIVRHARHSADEGIAADPRELLYRGQATDVDVTRDDPMPAERNAVGEGDAVADMAIVRDVRIGHEVSLIAHLRLPAAFFGSAIHRDMFADDIAGPDCEPCSGSV